MRSRERITGPNAGKRLSKIAWLRIFFSGKIGQAFWKPRWISAKQVGLEEVKEDKRSARASVSSTSENEFNGADHAPAGIPSSPSDPSRSSDVKQHNNVNQKQRRSTAIRKCS